MQEKYTSVVDGHTNQSCSSANADLYSHGYRLLVLFLLFIVYTLSFVDRQIISILALPIKAELHLSDTQLGAMGGIAFALFYATLGLPIALLADRYSRTWIITAALGLWSMFTAMCGLTTSFAQLFLCRMGVGVGEAGGAAPSYALISDYFPSHTRARALAVYSLGIPVGSAAGVMLGGWLASVSDWRVAFVVVGGGGVLFAPIFRLVVREPLREGTNASSVQALQPSLLGVMKLLARKPSFWLMSFGASAGSALNYGMIFWLPSFFSRALKLSVLDVSHLYAAMVFVGGTAGIVFGGVMGDYLSRTGRRGYALIPVFTFLAAVPFSLGGALSSTPMAAFLLFLVPTALGLAYIGPVMSAIQSLVPTNMRSTASALFLFLTSVFGIGVGTVYFGFLSDMLHSRYGDNSLRYAIILGQPFYLIAAGLFGFAVRHIDQDWHLREPSRYLS